MTLQQRIAYFHRWARVDREFATRQAKREEKDYPGLCAGVKAALDADAAFARPTKLFSKTDHEADFSR